MSGPLIFISRSRVKPGKLAQFEEHLLAANEIVDSEEPRMIGFNTYKSEDGSDAVRPSKIHPDEDSVDTHLKIYFDRLAERAFDAVATQEMDGYLGVRARRRSRR